MKLDGLEALLVPIFAAPETFRAATLTGRRRDVVALPEGEEPFRRVDVEPIRLKGNLHFQFAYRFSAKVTHRNLAPTEAQAHLAELLTTTFSQAQLRATDMDYHLALGRDGRWTVRKTAKAMVSQAIPAEHNRRKNYLLPEGEPIPFLIRLGVMTADGKVIAAKYDKFRQINRFLEMVADTLPSLPPDDSENPLRVVDFGSGKSYLTFALYYFLHITHGRAVHIVGLDRKRDVIDGCARIAADLGWADGLRFETGDIGGYAGAASADMVVSLHACDTATDDALAKAVGWDASVILSVPCCQHELNGKIDAHPTPDSPDAALRPLLKHGILKERMAALATDALRAQMLERAGYQVQVLEFIDMEHTPKNLLLRAVRRPGDTRTPSPRIADEYAAFRDFWQLSPYLDTLFAPRED
jgi:SAM-dependent methyltransferase